MNNLAITAALATAPASAFAELRERPRYWFPLLLVVLTTAGVVSWYYSVVDIEWFKDAMFANNPDFQKLPEDQRTAQLSMINRTTLLWSSMIGTIIFTPVVLLLTALYFLVAAKVTKVSVDYKHWFTLACWTSMPLVLNNIIAAIMLLMSDTTQIDPGVSQPLSLNELVFHLPASAPGYGLLTAVGIPALLSFALLIIGVRVWSQRSWLFSATFSLLPYVLLYGIWAFFAFR